MVLQPHPTLWRPHAGLLSVPRTSSVREIASHEHECQPACARAPTTAPAERPPAIGCCAALRGAAPSFQPRIGSMAGASRVLRSNLRSSSDPPRMERQSLQAGCSRPASRPVAPARWHHAATVPLISPARRQKVAAKQQQASSTLCLPDYRLLCAARAGMVHSSITRVIGTTLPACVRCRLVGPRQRRQCWSASPRRRQNRRRGASRGPGRLLLRLHRLLKRR